MRYLIIGLGIYGSNLAVDLTNMGHEVVGADINETIVNSIKDYVSTAYIVDSTDETSLKMLPLSNIDTVIVAIGENFGASIRTVALLKQLGMKHIFARAIDKLHESILEGFHIDRIIRPEQRAAEDLVHELELGANVSSLRVNDDSYVIRFEVPPFFIGMKYSDINFEKEYHVRLIAATRPVERINIVGISSDKQEAIDFSSTPSPMVTRGDMLTCYATTEAYRDLCRRIN